VTGRKSEVSPLPRAEGPTEDRLGEVFVTRGGPES